MNSVIFMLFNKKTRFQLTEKQIKEEIKNNEGTVLLRINLRYPEIKCPKSDPMSKQAQGFYAEIAKGFAEYAKGDLLSAAKTVCKAKKEEFQPFSALMKYEITLENSEYLSILTEFSVSDGLNPPFTERQTQVWSRSSGTKCSFSQLCRKEKLKARLDELLEKSEKRYFDKELFVLRESTVDFHLLQKDGYRTISIPKDELLKTPIQA